MTPYDDPEQLAAVVAAHRRPILIGLDVDGVLAPLVDHADDAVLLPGISEAIDAAATSPGTSITVVSGRSIADLARFGFSSAIDVIGSHGMETRDRPNAPLTAGEQSLMAALDQAAVAAATRAGTGAWVERKPVSVVLHVRQADRAAGNDALGSFGDAVATHAGATTKAGSYVLEAFVRDGDKGRAITDLARRLAAATTVFVGDDITDEDAFAALGADDVTIKVGDAPTCARYRLRDPEAVLRWLLALA